MSLIIAEIGHNHNGDMDIARDLIRQAYLSGADIAKFQLYDTAKIVEPDFEWYWDLKRGELTRKQWGEIVGECRNVGIEFMASVFDVERVEWCEEADMARYKIASRSIYNKELLDAVADTGKDMVVSLGMYNELDFPLINTMGKVDFLYCVAKYPTLPEDIHFPDFEKYSGFSDHTIGIEASVMAMARGAGIIEKHLTLDKQMEGADHAGSMEPQELAQLARFSYRFRELL